MKPRITRREILWAGLPGYTPDSRARKGYRTIKVDVRKKGLVVRGRHGYYPGVRLKVDKS